MSLVLRPDAPIGVFDSGLGGLTVLQRLREQLPQERLVYVADQAHVPYGGRDLNEIRHFAREISAGLLAYGCKAVVMACNISSATALPVVQEAFPAVPVIGMILPGAKVAAARTRNGSIGVLTTAGTKTSGAYTRALHALDPSLMVREVACPQFVPLVEAGEEETPAAFAAAQDYLQPLLAAKTDTIILGCTHYPFLLPVLRRLAPSQNFIDPAQQAVCQLTDLLTARQLLADPDSPHLPDTLTTTGDTDAFAHQLRRFLSDAAPAVAAATWTAGKLILPIG